ncbi:cytochrome C oxidase subunit I [Actibacterium mucosum KCTC 23349]|uniref:Cytochrome C oxidase subunit I n=1 Tax=Actibacterium mucosum KCTC 23349 TaxID=1454373 RepID=A0A037ZEP0_9RHOB|nr:DUF2189 domain-containing protein [Actibacterium mucosum]KAJ54915.1 cytochrome C oxidase subunit I [Actibacterium mucosum KCTC 23349]
MPQTIGNPASWGLRGLRTIGGHMVDSSRRVGSDDATEMPQIRTLSRMDMRAAVWAGWRDFQASRSDAIFLVLLYPVIGLVLMAVGLQMAALPLLFPLMAGFALLGPVAAVGLYEISRRRETGENANWLSAFSVVQRPRFGAIFVLGLYLAGLFLLWMMAANAVYVLTLGPGAPTSLSQFAMDVFTTAPGWAMMIIGFGVGFLFALLVLVVSLISFPMLLHRNVGLPVAVATSVAVFRHNPRIVLSWGAMVAALLMLGSIPMLAGLIVVMPLLGHATWHFYRRAVI